MGNNIMDIFQGHSDALPDRQQARN